MNAIVIVRWLHILSGAAWLGEVITINFVVIPSLRSMGSRERPRFIRNVFPRLFRLASVFSLLSISSGLTLSWLVTGWNEISIFFTTRWGLSIFIGGLLGVALTTFHFLVESRLEPIAASLDDDAEKLDIEKVINFLRVVPRVGLVVMITIFILMMYAARVA